MNKHGCVSEGSKSVSSEKMGKINILFFYKCLEPFCDKKAHDGSKGKSPGPLKHLF